jgi:hypothetical protein
MKGAFRIRGVGVKLVDSDDDIVVRVSESVSIYEGGESCCSFYGFRKRRIIKRQTYRGYWRQTPVSLY